MCPVFVSDTTTHPIAHARNPHVVLGPCLSLSPHTRPVTQHSVVLGPGLRSIPIALLRHSPTTQSLEPSSPPSLSLTPAHQFPHEQPD